MRAWLFPALAIISLHSQASAQPQDGRAPQVDPSLIPYASTANSVQLPDERELHFVCMGSGSPVVVLAAGGSDWSIEWNKVQPGVAAKTRVCSWDRAGLGLSSPSHVPPAPERTTADLKAGLAAAGISGPYVLVGHSIGGLDALLFADRYPADVAGMVLVDPTPPGDMTSRLDRHTPAINALMALDPPFVATITRCSAGLRAGTIRIDAPIPDPCLSPPPSPPEYPSELQAALEKSHAGASPTVMADALDNIAYYSSSKLLEEYTRATAKPGRSYGKLPLVVLTAGTFIDSSQLPADIRAELPIQTREKKRVHDQLARLSTQGVHLVVSDSSHDIPHLAPGVVVKAVDDVVESVRRVSGPSKR